MSAQVLAKVDSVEVRRPIDPDAQPEINADHYTGEPDARRAEYLAQDKERAEAFEREEWAYVGVIAVAKVRFYLSSHPDGSCGGFEVSSTGIWGVESDSDPDYFAELEGEQRGELAEMLHALGLWPIDPEPSESPAPPQQFDAADVSLELPIESEDEPIADVFEAVEMFQHQGQQHHLFIYRVEVGGRVFNVDMSDRTVDGKEVQS